MSEFAVINASSRVTAEDFAYAVEAANIQMERDFCPAYGLEPWPVVAYKTAPESGAYPIGIMDRISDDPNEEGYHSFFGGDGVFARVLADDLFAVTLTHEAVEARANSQISIWVPRPAGGSVPYEPGDPVEADTYGIAVELFGQKRVCEVTNFVLPSWFVPDSKGPWDYCEKLTGPFQLLPGGYMLVKDDVGDIAPIFGSEAAALRYHAKRTMVGSRVHRLTGGR